MTTPLARGNALLRRLRALRRDGALRDREQVFVAEGPKVVGEALACGAPIEFVVISEAATDDPWRADRDGWAARLERSGASVYTVADSVMRSLQDARSPQEILAVVRREAPPALTAGHGSPLIVVACDIQDPGNLGTLLRTADAAGADRFLAAGLGADLYHPRTVRASAGSIFRVPSVACTLADLPELQATHGLRLIGTTPDDGRVYDEIDFKGGVAVLFGGESRGLPTRVLDRLDSRLSIPMRAGVESLSVGAAAAVVLFEAARQRRVSVP